MATNDEKIIRVVIVNIENPKQAKRKVLKMVVNSMILNAASRWKSNADFKPNENPAYNK